MSEPKPSPTTASVESRGAVAGTRAILAWRGVGVNSPKALISDECLRAAVHRVIPPSLHRACTQSHDCAGTLLPRSGMDGFIYQR